MQLPARTAKIPPITKLLSTRATAGSAPTSPILPKVGATPQRRAAPKAKRKALNITSPQAGQEKFLDSGEGGMYLTYLKTCCQDGRSAT